MSPPLAPQRWERRRLRHLLRHALLPEHLLALAVTLGWIFTIETDTSDATLSAIAVVFLAFAIEAGGQLFAASAAGALLFLTAFGAAASDNPLLPTAGGISTLVVFDLCRLGTARRRRGEVSGGLRLRLLAIDAAIAIAALAVVNAAPQTRPTARPWGLVPLSVGAVAAVSAAILLLAARGIESGDDERWHPGFRLLPRRASD